MRVKETLRCRAVFICGWWWQYSGERGELGKTTQMSLFDVDKFCLFRVPTGRQSKNNRAICWMESCQILLWTDAQPKMHLGWKADESANIAISQITKKTCYYSIHFKSRATATLTNISRKTNTCKSIVDSDGSAFQEEINKSIHSFLFSHRLWFTVSVVIDLQLTYVLMGVLDL